MTTLNDTERQFAEQLLLAVKNRAFTVTYGELAERVVPPANPRNVGRNIENISMRWRPPPTSESPRTGLSRSRTIPAASN